MWLPLQTALTLEVGSGIEHNSEMSKKVSTLKVLAKKAWRKFSIERMVSFFPPHKLIVLIQTGKYNNRKFLGRNQYLENYTIQYSLFLPVVQKDFSYS